MHRSNFGLTAGNRGGTKGEKGRDRGAGRELQAGSERGSWPAGGGVAEVLCLTLSFSFRQSLPVSLNVQSGRGQAGAGGVAARYLRTVRGRSGR